MVSDLETEGIIGLMSSKGLGLMTEIKDPWLLLLSDVNESLLRQSVNFSDCSSKGELSQARHGHRVLSCHPLQKHTM